VTVASVRNDPAGAGKDWQRASALSDEPTSVAYAFFDHVRRDHRRELGKEVIPTRSIVRPGAGFPRENAAA
jgi:hypothetical protein